MPLLLLLFAFLLAGPAAAQAPSPLPPSFWVRQLGYPRVRAAYARCWPALAARLQAQHLDSARLEVFFRLIKTHRALEVWARNRGEAAFRQLRSYPLAATSGTLGPKRRAGDGQVPEGFYTIDRFNPQSAYHLSLGLDYPTADDLLATGLADPGGDIFLHGADVTDGCLPLTDAGIEEVYLLAVAARAAGQVSISVHLFPFPLLESELRQRAASPHAAFWRGLAPGYAYFEAHRAPAPPLAQYAAPATR
ncbi:L,D-transpeptidase family protein [Hymenobacter cheonanensis]|uniref:L,D-transpeptidase family protein n=1 Tax=Hymenobacter sp. CA2-7 TaxID=3063993 RepID=UPI002713F505|nr:L,D-transpeptidase family protein [Hymenobacter sp. CA2-7]MDO7886462.1 hypothetical protein [Hymenobacter sp. CA2-7]